MLSPPKIIGRRRDREEYENSCGPSPGIRDERLSGGVFSSYVVKYPSGKRRRIVTSPGPWRTPPRREKAEGRRRPSAHASRRPLSNSTSVSVNTGTYVSSLDYGATQMYVYSSILSSRCSYLFSFGNLQLPSFLQSTTSHSANNEQRQAFSFVSFYQAYLSC